MTAENIPPKRQRGFVKLVVILVIVLVVLGYFGFNLENIVNSPAVSANLHYVWNLAVAFWNNFLAAPAVFIWDKIIIGIFWNTLVSLTDKAEPVLR